MDFELPEMDFDLDIDFDLEDFSVFDDDELETRILKPKVAKKTVTQKMKYEYALDLADKIELGKDVRTFAIVSGNFYFGDFIEALIEKRKIKPKKIYISTLSLNENNVDSLRNVVEMSNIQELNVILSDYFYSHEKHNLVPYLYDELDVDNVLQVAFCSSHCKICLIETETGEFYTMHGSANLRSSSNIEQFCFEENEELFEFNRRYMDDILNIYATINKNVEQKNKKSIRGNKLWQVVAEKQAVAEKKQVQEKPVQQRKDVKNKKRGD